MQKNFNILTSLKNYEYLLFGLFFLLNLIPLFSNSYFISFDGPAHLYNANIISSMLVNQESVFTSFFEWNNQLVPNWTGHIILSLFSFFFNSVVAEKTLMIIFAFLFSYGFRFLVKQISHENLFIAYLIFPFVFSFFFFMGFYNFLIGVALLFFAIGLFLKQMKRGYVFKNVILMILLLFLMFCSHALPLAIFMIFVTIYFSVSFFRELINPGSKNFKGLFTNALILLAIGSVPFFLTIHYFLTDQQGGELTYMKGEELLRYLLNGKTLVGLNETEIFFTSFFTYFLLTLFLVGLLFSKIKRTLTKESFILFLVLSIGMFVLYVYLPFSNTTASYINTRFLLFFLLFFMVWLSTLKFPVFVKLISVLIVFIISYNLNMFYFDSNKAFSQRSKSISVLGTKIPEGSVILPLNYSRNWLYAHHSNYLAADNDLIILENYESEQSYFPIQWNENDFPKLLLGSKEQDQFDCINWKTSKENSPREIGYLFIMGRKQLDSTSNCFLKLDSVLSSSFELVENQYDFELYKSQ